MQRIEIVVDGAHISAALIIPAAGLVHKAGIVQRADGLHCPGRVKLAPAFVERHPAADTGMAGKRLYRGFQLPAVFFPAAFLSTAQQLPEWLCIGQAAQQRLQHIGQVGDEPQLVGAAAVHHVLPDHKAQPVAVVIPALRLDFCVLAQQVEAQRFHLAQLPLHRRIGRRGIQALRPVALIQQAVEQDGLSVQAEAQHALRIRLTAPLAQGKVAVHGVELFLLSLCGSHGQVIQKRGIRAPRKEMFLRDVQRHLAVPVRFVAAPVLGNGHAPGPHHGPQVHRTAGHGSMGFHGHGAGIVVRRDRERLDVVFRHTLQPDRLPDAALGRIEHAAGLQGLLAPGLRAAVRGVLHGHPQAVAACAVELGGDIQCEGPVAAPMAAHQMAVHLHRTGIVHRTEVQQHPAPFSRRGSKGAVVVQPLAGLQGAAHAGGLCLRRVGHQNAAVPRSGVFSCLSNGIFPQAVQVLIAVPAHGRARIFREWVHGFTAFDLLVSF